MASQTGRPVVLPPDTEKKILGIFTKDRKFYSVYIPLLLKVSAQQLAALMVNLVDNLMLGRYSEYALSGATLVNQLQFTMQQIASGIGMGIVVLAAQYWGKGETGPIKKIISIGVKAGFLVGVLFFAATMIAPHPILSIFTQNQDVLAEGVRYLRIMSWTYILFGLSNSLMYALQSIETVMIGTIMSLSTIGINIFFNYAMIYGNLGFPEMGIMGAAIATLISRTAELAIVLCFILFKDRKLKMKLRELLAFNFTYLSDFVKISTPVAVTGLLWGVAQAAQTAVLGHISAETLAANSVAIVIFQLLAVVGRAGANASSVFMGKMIGERRYNKIRPYAKSLQGIYIIMGISVFALIFFLRDIIIAQYNLSQVTAGLASQFLLILSITTIGTCYEFPCECGIIAGGGSTKYPAIIDNLFMWLFTIPSAFISAFVLHTPPWVTFMLLKADQVLKCIPNGIVVNRFRWVRELTRETGRKLPDAGDGVRDGAENGGL